MMIVQSSEAISCYLRPHFNVSTLKEYSITLSRQIWLQKAMKNVCMQYVLFPERPGVMRILTQLPSGVASMAIRCRAYLNLLLALTKEG
jgi:hypothetical protein